MTSKLALKSLRVRNFKAIRDSKVIKFGALTAFIGNNGSGKSSLLEALSAYQAIVRNGVEDAMNQWLGFEHIWNKAVSHPTSKITGDRPHLANPMEFRPQGKNYRASLKLTTTPNHELFILEETLSYTGRDILTRGYDGAVKRKGEKTELVCLDDQSFLSLSSFTNIYPYSHIPTVLEEIEGWQFVNFDPLAMGNPQNARRVGKNIQLLNNGANLSEYLLDIYQKDQDAFENILETLQYVLPYVNDLQATQTSIFDIQPKVYLQLTESNFKIPGWLFSTGTLRVLALLAMLKHPTPPPLILIEEIENGLDPRTIHLLVEEIRNAVEDGRTQIIITTHSPYLLDLLDISHLILVERNEKGEPLFIRPDDHEMLDKWTKEFSPGELYTMGKFSRG